jgi:hypothetical protein
LLSFENFNHSIVHLLEKCLYFGGLFLCISLDWDFYEWFYCLIS